MTDNVSTEQLRNDLATLMRDAEALIKASAEPGHEKLAEAKARIRETVDAAKRRLADAQHFAAQEGAAAVHATDDYVRRNPWQAVGIAAGVGLLAGLLLSRR
jgi:ElaB/YqjD/DUF883 family membrane-anchored ribosome-binding protein